MIAVLFSGIHSKVTPPPPTTLTATANYMSTEYGAATPQPDNLYWRSNGLYQTPSYFVEFNTSKVNPNAPISLTTQWSYEGKLVTTQKTEISTLTSYNNTLGAWVSPEVNWQPEAWNGENYKWKITSSWSNPAVKTWTNLYPKLGELGSLLSLFNTPDSKMTTLGGTGASTMDFAVNPEPVSSFLFLTGGALLAARLRKKRK